ncbi:site-specific DNA-methyltransferase [Anaerotignum lactatifermentans]|uniref:Site-specific DNA-methyltransferase n=1 Tax=Anaerotignum lactatifermentans TaxID=160404 RepID=A0ABS2GDM6_9FIRM|nr:site-specific DNA-methyltransferase [Anaerotignum lactatifermentans]MBM6830305.1 site-specific DNA-methyltransferase [Anaerotignum lactatifermentans]MBM6878883.1 site-specific DNA-methyltransferase [Anaerotignum lactatifermentans]MBM6951941.1 site-specific DNA-methyltransferase [Anaerotignum lactatifermentans]
MSENILDGLSMNIEQANMDKLKSVFPECFAEGKLDIDKLLSLCGEYIDNDFEKYKFEWKGKAECLRLAQKRSTGTLRPCLEESVNWDDTKNLYIEGDNLEVLKLLQTAYYRKVKMIYIDPPYNTGNDFVYEDDFADPLARYKEVTQQTTKSNPETMGRYHTNWLNMMYPRLRLAANLLRDDGVIFISVDENEVINLRKLCDEVFGEENFVIQIVWKKRSTPPNDKIIGSAHEYIVLYAKRIDSVVLNLRERTPEQLARYQNPDNHPKGPWTSGDLGANVKGGRYVESLYFSIQNPNTGEEHYPPQNGNWRFNQETIKRLLENNEIYFGEDGKGRPKLKRFLCDVKNGITYTSLWDFVPLNTQGSKEMTEILGNISIFDNPKPVNLIKELVKLGSDKESIVFDFFSGSATTAHAVMQLNAEDGGNRQFIMVQLPEVCDEKSEAYKAGYKNICEIGKERIRRAGKKILEENNQMTLEDKEQLDIGFKVFKLDSSNLKTWDNTPVTAEQLDLLYERMNNIIHRVKSDRSDLDMVCEIMLKLGVPLTYSITAVEINGKTAYSIGEDSLLLICLALDVQPEDVEQMAEYAPAKLIISRESFVDDTAMANAHYILKDHGVELKLV